MHVADVYTEELGKVFDDATLLAVRERLRLLFPVQLVDSCRLGPPRVVCCRDGALRRFCCGLL